MNSDLMKHVGQRETMLVPAHITTRAVYEAFIQERFGWKLISWNSEVHSHYSSPVHVEVDTGNAQKKAFLIVRLPTGNSVTVMMIQKIDGEYYGWVTLEAKGSGLMSLTAPSGFLGESLTEDMSIGDMRQKIADMAGKKVQDEACYIFPVGTQIHVSNNSTMGAANHANVVHTGSFVVLPDNVVVPGGWEHMKLSMIPFSTNNMFVSQTAHEACVKLGVTAYVEFSTFTVGEDTEV